MLSLQRSLTKKSSRQNIPSSGSTLKKVQKRVGIVRLKRCSPDWVAGPPDPPSWGLDHTLQEVSVAANDPSTPSCNRAVTRHDSDRRWMGWCVGVNSLINRIRSCFPSISLSVKVCKLPGTHPCKSRGKNFNAPINRTWVHTLSRAC